MLPRVTLYNEISLDGRIEGLQMDVGRFYRLSFRWHADAILVGSRTALSFGPPEPAAEQATELPAPTKEPLYPGFEGLVYQPRPIIIIPDSRGQVRNWQAIHAQPWYRDPVALISRATLQDYLAYLKRRHVAVITAGDDHVDLARCVGGAQRAFRCSLDPDRLRRCVERRLVSGRSGGRSGGDPEPQPGGQPCRTDRVLSADSSRRGDSAPVVGGGTLR